MNIGIHSSVGQVLVCMDYILLGWNQLEDVLQIYIQCGLTLGGNLRIQTQWAPPWLSLPVNNDILTVFYKCVNLQLPDMLLVLFYVWDMQRGTKYQKDFNFPRTGTEECWEGFLHTNSWQKQVGLLTVYSIWANTLHSSSYVSHVLSIIQIICCVFKHGMLQQW